MLLIDQNERTEIFEHNKLIGYVDDDILYRFGLDGYAIAIGPVADRSKIADMLTCDPIVERNRQMLLDRSKLGIAKYGVTLADANLTLRQWLQHALEETLDKANYLQAAIAKLDGQI